MKFRALVGAVSVAASLVASQLTGVAPASAWPSSTVQLQGHGWGHGRGLSQYGSLGYALDGWDYTTILDHYYGGTAMGSTPNLAINVRFTNGDGQDLIVTSATNYAVAGHAVGGGTAALVHRTASNTFEVFTGPSCGGPWTSSFTTTGKVIATPNNGSQPVSNPNLSQMLQRCASDGTRGYRGNVSITDDSGTTHSWSELLLEDYLRGVVPRESPASWGDSGGGAGMNALRAQAVAARSYVASPGGVNPVSTCDSTACQVYGGAFLNGTLIEDSRTNTAIDGTAGKVRVFTGGSKSGQVAKTEFSSSSGGYTAGGDFPAVVDDGDATGSNPNHTWSASVDVSAIQSAYPSIGTLQSLTITGRNGLGDYGGRVTTISIIGTNGSVSDSGAGFRSKLGLKSDWFQLVNVASGGVAGYWLLGDDGGIFSFGSAQFFGSMGGKPLNKPVVNLASTPNGGGYWEVASDGGIFAYGNAQFFGSMGGKPLNKPIVGMASTPTGHGYWMVASDGGIFAYGDAQFFGSMGGKPLNKPIVGMASTPSGNGYWLVASDGGIFAYGDAQFFGSMGGQPLNKPIVGIAAKAGGGYWMVASDGGIFAFGGANYVGSLPGSNVAAIATAIAPTKTGGGYVITTVGGVVYSFGDAPQFGSLPAVVPGFRGQVLAVVPTS